ncbi:unnamed protein product (macronuclear) [Paramecium tetraurelia]|uniref:Transmembrane protein n=1 Tax=Paramecium tetraurelia TaxID=5888 RepID=A0C8H8_PARTE|nr:uncharacterized protein GSPATT00036228001 [Paramecium tetraurelia]CAK67095.1 unnamed protein product [Paramecium tetraurelia]|eukprot:XP_001434492.1 hypothetical protein (macronuclear) [Paramecium tetraurelia strain d4-2]
MKSIILQFITPYLLTLLMLPEISCDKPKVFCNKNQIQEFQTKFFPIIFQSNEKSDYVYKENPQFLEQIISFDEELLQEDDYILIFSSIQEYRLIQIYQREKRYLLQMKELRLSIFDSKEYNVQMELIYSLKFNIENCDKITHVYYLIKQKFIICCEQIENYQINIIKINESTVQIQQSFDVKKQSKCQFDVYFNENSSQFLVIFLNCLNWEIFMIEFNNDGALNFRLFVNNHYFIDQLILRKVTFDNNYFFQFDHWIVSFQGQTYNKIYQNYESTILDFEIKLGRQVIVLQSIYEQKSSIQRMVEQNLSTFIIITKYIKPRQILMFSDSIVLISESHLECIVREDMIYIFQVQLQSIQTISFYPFFIGKQNNQFIVFKKNEYSPFFNCNDYSNQTLVDLASSNLFQNAEFLQMEIIFNDFSMYGLRLLSIKKVIEEESFQFTFQPQEFKSDFLPFNIQFLKNDAIYCEEQQYEVMQDCLNEQKLEILWQVDVFQNRQVVKVIQLKQSLQIIVIMCYQNTNLNLGYFGEIEKENVYVFNSDVFLLTNQRKKVLRLNLRRPTLWKGIYEFKDEVINISYQNLGHQIVLKSCVSYLILSNEKIIEQQIYKLNSNGQCIQERIIYSDFLEIDFSRQVFIFKSENLTNTIRYQNQTIHSLHQFYFNKNSFLVISTIGNKTLAILYSYFNFQLIPITQIFNENLNYAYPLKHSINSFFLIIAAFDSQNNSVLAVYSLTHLYRSNLIDIIKVDNFTFTQASYNEIFFFQQQQLKRLTILEISLQCRINIFTDFIKQINAPILLIDKLDQNHSQLHYIQFKLINGFQQLKSISTEVQQFQYHIFQQFILFDPRRFVIGPIETISINAYELVFPLVQIDSIKRRKCKRVDNAVCINENNQSLTISNIYGAPSYYKAFDLQQKIDFRTISSELYFIVWYQQGSDQFVELYLKTNLESIANFTLIHDERHYIINISIANQYCVISFQLLLSFYEIQNNTLTLINSYDCNYCQVNQIVNSNFVAIHERIIQNETIEFIIYDIVNQVHFQVIVPINEFIYDSVAFQSKFEILFMEQKDDNQYYAQIILFSRPTFIQVLELSFNNESTTIERNGLIRVSATTMNQQILLMQNNQILIISYNDIKNHSQRINVYNISEFNLINEIYILSKNISLVHKYNESHLIVVEDDDSQDHTVYQVDSYKIKIDQYQTKSFNLTFKNSLSQLEFQIDLKNENEENIFQIQLCIIIVCEIILFSFLLKRRRSKTVL